MKSKYLKKFPQPLLDDLVDGRWLPIVGAGLSKNAVISYRRTMPLWNELGKGLAKDMQDYEYFNPLDAISAYSHEFGRPKLIEKLSELLFINEAQPGKTHRAFCALKFDIVCTTNFDFLLERQYGRNSTPYTLLIKENQLSIKLPSSHIALFKLHGDLNDPDRLVATEEDYDVFLERYPVIATYLANLLITRTPVLIGYSLDDPDFRQVWQVVGERLGEMRRPAYALCVGASPTEIARLGRRGVKVINLASDKSKYGEILSETFDELKNYWEENVELGEVTEEELLRELLLPRDSATRLCFFSLPLSAYPFYRDQVFPLVREVGLVPVTGDEIISPGENILAKIEALISRAFLVIVDASSEFTLAEARMAAARDSPGRLLIIIEEGISIPIDIQSPINTRGLVDTQRINILHRPDLASVEVEEFLDSLNELLQIATEELEQTLPNEAQRLLRAREYRAAVISAITHLETTLRERLDLSSVRERLDLSVREGRRFVSVGEMLKIADRESLLGEFKVSQVLQWIGIRNKVVHSHASVSERTAQEIVNGVGEITGPWLR